MRWLVQGVVAVGVVGVVLLVADAASARMGAPRAANTVATTPRPLQTTARSKTFIVSTATGHTHVSLPPLNVAPVDRDDPWRGGVISTERPRAALDLADPWTGARISVTSRTLAADTTDPWR